MLFRVACAVLAIVCLAGCNPKKVVTVNGKTAEDWSKTIETAKSDARMDALAKISQICEKDPTQVPFMAVGLKHDDSATRMTAIKLLKNLGPKAALAVPDLQAIIANEGENSFNKKEAEEALAVIQAGAPGAIPAAAATPGQPPTAPSAAPPTAPSAAPPTAPSAAPPTAPSAAPEAK